MFKNETMKLLIFKTIIMDTFFSYVNIDNEMKKKLEIVQNLKFFNRFDDYKKQVNEDKNIAKTTNTKSFFET